MALPIIDEIVVNEDGSVTAWACALNDLGIVRVPLRECAAPRRECPRGFHKSFECKGHGALEGRNDG
jgi:hypothetical protein